jgi:large subunit ribosomal protein L6
MSRIGKQPVIIPSGIDVTIDGTMIMVKGPKGALTRTLHDHVTVTQENGAIHVTVGAPDEKGDRALWGLSRALIANMVHGVAEGYEKKLEMVGVGYKAAVAGTALTLNLGFSHPIELIVPKGLTAEVDKNTNISIQGIDKELVGNFAAKIRKYRKPEPYKGKGVRYAGEVVRRKAGKSAKSAA